MRKLLPILLLAFLFAACTNGKKAPDVSSIEVPLSTERFEKAIFDTSSGNLVNYLKGIHEGNPAFTQTYLYQILGLDPRMSADSNAMLINSFIQYYRSVYDTSQKKFGDFTPYEKEIRRGLQYVKHYFPSYPLPKKIITYIGPADGSGDAISDEGILVGLHHHLGANFPLYQTESVQTYYPTYISRRFEPEYIAVNAMKNIVSDIYPEAAPDQSLVNQMVEKGKRLYVLQLLLPKTPEYLLIGYTEKQWKECYQNEAKIWNLFVKNDYLRTTDKNIVKNFLDEGPKTDELGEGAPGNIGSFSGLQIVKKYMEAHPANTPIQLMNIPSETLFQEAKYKP